MKISSLNLSFKNLSLLLIGSSFLGVSISYGDFYLFHLVLFIYYYFFILKLKYDEYTIDSHLLSVKYVTTLLLVFGWFLISLSWSQNLILGLKYIFYLMCGITITLSLISYISNLNYLNKVFYILSFFVSLEIFISALESFSSFRMPISSYSDISHLFGKSPLSQNKSDIYLFYSSIRPPTGFRWNTNDLAISMVIAFPFFLCSRKNIVKIFGILTITTIVIMTASRAVFLSLILIYSIYLFVIKKKVATISLIWIATISILFGMFQFKESENPRMNELANSVEAAILFLSGEVDFGGSLEWRRELVNNGLVAFFQSFGLGLGAGGSVANQELIGPVAGRFTSMHNFWIELLVEGGVFVGCLMTFWIVSIIYKLFIISRSSTKYDLKYYGESLFLSMVAFVPAAIAASSTIYFFPMWIMFGLAISVIYLYENEKISYLK